MSVIRVFDLETSGMKAPPAVVIESGWCDIDLESMKIGSPENLMWMADDLPPEARAVNHITMADLAGRPTFDADEFADMARKADAVAMACHFYEFDGQFFTPDIPIICTYKAALRIWPDAPSHSNQALRYWLGDQGLLPGLNDRIAHPPHRAGPDAYVTAHILKAALATGVTGKTMTGWTKLPALQPRCGLGKHRGVAWADVPRSYLEWIGKPNDVDADTKWNAARELNRRSGI